LPSVDKTVDKEFDRHTTDGRFSTCDLFSPH